MNELLAPGLEISLVGMSIVFVFLVMLIFSVNIMSAVILRFFPEAPAPVEMKKTAKDEIDSDVVAAISAAVHRHRARHAK